MKQIILTLAAVAASVTAVSGQDTGAYGRYYIDGLIYERTSEATVSCDGAFDDGVKNVVIPETINADGTVFTVIGISDRAFYQNYSLSSITIPKTIESISEDAFATGSSNISVYISDLAAWCKIDFENKYANPLSEGGDSKLYVNGVLVTDLKIPDGITEIKPYSFCGFDSMASLTIPSSVATIGTGAFSGCSGLTSLTIPNSVTTIGGIAFSGCSGLTSLTIPNNVTTIGNSAFSSCGLVSIVIPNSITTISLGTFNGCYHLESVTIGSKVILIEDAAFLECKKISGIKMFSSNPPEAFIGQNVWGTFDYHIFENAVLSVPTGSLGAYKSAEVWKEFKNIQEKDFGGVDGVENDAVSVTAKGGSIEISGAGNAPVEVYNLSGQLVYSGTETTVGGLARGIYIVRVAGHTFKVAL